MVVKQRGNFIDKEKTTEEERGDGSKRENFVDQRKRVRSN